MIRCQMKTKVINENEVSKVKRGKKGSKSES